MTMTGDEWTTTDALAFLRERKPTTDHLPLAIFTAITLIFLAIIYAAAPRTQPIQSNNRPRSEQCLHHRAQPPAECALPANTATP